MASGRGQTQRCMVSSRFSMQFTAGCLKVLEAAGFEWGLSARKSHLPEPVERPIIGHCGHWSEFVATSTMRPVADIGGAELLNVRFQSANSHNHPAAAIPLAGWRYRKQCLNFLTPEGAGHLLRNLLLASFKMAAWYS